MKISHSNWPANTRLSQQEQFMGKPGDLQESEMDFDGGKSRA
jgi:hypothetical protein